MCGSLKIILHCLSLGLECEPGSPALQEDSLPTELSGKPNDFHYLEAKNKIFFLSQDDIY